MDMTTFLSEAERLVRPGLLLQEGYENSPYAYWHGINNGELCVSLNHHGRWLNIFTDMNGGGYVEQTDVPVISSIPLYGTPFASLPPVDAVFAKGSSAIGSYLQRHDWPRTESYNPNFPDTIPSDYERK